MKAIYLIIVTLFMSLAGEAQFTRANLQASGLTCSMCSKAVKLALEKVPFVKEVNVDLNKQEYQLSFQEGMAVDFDALRKAVEHAGFAVASLEVFGNFSEVTAARDNHFSMGGLHFHWLNGKNKVLNGEGSFKIVDKEFLLAKEYKKWSNASSMECAKTGVAGDCCTKEGIPANARIYHIAI